jgi:hypothetical protein
MQGRLFLNIVVRKGTAILELFASENQTLLVGRDTLLVLNLGLNIIDGIGGLDLESDGLASQGLDKDLHSTAETEDQVKSRLLLYVTAEMSKTVSIERIGG